MVGIRHLLLWASLIFPLCAWGDEEVIVDTQASILTGDGQTAIPMDGKLVVPSAESPYLKVKPDPTWRLELLHRPQSIGLARVLYRQVEPEIRVELSPRQRANLQLLVGPNHDLGTYHTPWLGMGEVRWHHAVARSREDQLPKVIWDPIREAVEIQVATVTRRLENKLGTATLLPVQLRSMLIPVNEWDGPHMDLETLIEHPSLGRGPAHFDRILEFIDGKNLLMFPVRVIRMEREYSEFNLVTPSQPPHVYRVLTKLLVRDDESFQQAADNFVNSPAAESLHLLEPFRVRKENRVLGFDDPPVFSSCIGALSNYSIR